MWILVKCFILGHEYDWDEYQKRIEGEQHHADGLYVFCERCRKYKKFYKN
jgi:hypothetical protein